MDITTRKFIEERQKKIYRIDQHNVPIAGPKVLFGLMGKSGTVRLVEGVGESLNTHAVKIWEKDPYVPIVVLPSLNQVARVGVALTTNAENLG